MSTTHHAGNRSRSQESAAEELARITRRPEPHPIEKPWPKMGDEAYIGLAGEFVRLVEPHTEADPVALLVQYLAAFGSVVGRGPHFDVSGDEHGTALYATLVGPTGEGRKGTSLAPVLKRFQTVFPGWAEVVVSGGMSTGEGLVNALQDRMTDETDETEEAEEDKRLFVIESELAAPIARMGREGNTLSAVLRSAWDSGNMNVLTRADALRCTGGHLTVVGHITEHELKARLNEGDAFNGFANRFMWFLVRRSKFLPRGGDLGSIRWDWHDERLRDAAERAGQRRRLNFADDAFELWDSEYEELTTGLPGLVGALTQRRAPQVLRVALIYALLDGASAVHEVHLRAALAVVEHSRASIEHLFGAEHGNRDAARILAALRERGAEGMRRSEFDALFQKNLKPGRLDDALDYLRSAGLATCRRESSGQGRPAEVWVAHLSKPS